MSKLLKYRPNLYDYLKVIAIIAMIIDHLGYFLYPSIIELRIIGRFAFPIFLFLVGRNGSYRHRRSLLIGAIALQIPTSYLQLQGNIGGPLFTILVNIGITRRLLLGLSLLKKSYQYIIAILAIIGIALLHPFITDIFDYGAMSFIFGILGYLVRNFPKHKIPNLIIGVATFVGHFIYQQETFRLATSGSIIVGIGFTIMAASLMFLQHKNHSLKVSKHTDTILIRISKNALRIYIAHIITFASIAIIKNY